MDFCLRGRRPRLRDQCDPTSPVEDSSWRARILFTALRLVPRDPDADKLLSDAKAALRKAKAANTTRLTQADEAARIARQYTSDIWLQRGDARANAKSVVSIMFHRGAEIPGEHPRLAGDGKLVRTMRFADEGELEAGRADLEAVIRAWCDWKG